jgi:tetratricopeptide (TPR) repeat protein
MRWRLVAFAGAAFLAVAPLAGQQEGVSRAFELERRGDYVAAADAYRAVLAGKPTDVVALLGLERVLVPLNRAGDLLPEVRAALAAKSPSEVVYGVALRAWAAADEPDSMRAVADRWAAVAPIDEAPYREWGAAALGRGDHAGAVEAYALGRDRLKRPDALAAERAQLAVMDGDYAGGLREWLAAVRRLPGYRLSAIGAMSQAPADARPGLLRILSREEDFIARRMEAELRVRWGDPVGGLQTLLEALPDGPGPAADALRELVDQLRAQQTPQGRLALARGLEALADRWPGGDRSRLRLESARAYTAAGDHDAARRMLAGLADDRSASRPVAAGASDALIRVLIAEGRLDEAARRLDADDLALSVDVREDLRLGLVSGWLRQGDLARAEAALGADSTVEAWALRGKILLFRGDISGAVEHFRKAGPYAGDRQEATSRTVLLALLQPLESDSLPSLGRAMLLLEKGDTAHAIAALEIVSRGVSAGSGGAGIAFLAGRLAAASGRGSDAERLFRAAAVKDAPGTAPAAELALGELFLSQDRTSDAVAQLEHLILTYPESALVPQARRRLDQARGAVPKT